MNLYLQKGRLGPYLGFCLWLTVLFLAVGQSVAAPVCDYCGKVIQDRYIEFEGKYYHSDCYHEHVAPRCAVCGQEIGPDGVVYEGRNYHRKCYEDSVAIRCSVCGGRSRQSRTGICGRFRRSMHQSRCARWCTR